MTKRVDQGLLAANKFRTEAELQAGIEYVRNPKGNLQAVHKKARAQKPKAVMQNGKSRSTATSRRVPIAKSETAKPRPQSAPQAVNARGNVGQPEKDLIERALIRVEDTARKTTSTVLDGVVSVFCGITGLD